VGVAVSGYQMKDGKADWKALTVAQDPKSSLALGNVGKLSNVQVTVRGRALEMRQSHRLTSPWLRKAFQADGKVYIVKQSGDETERVAFSDANIALQAPALGVAANGSLPPKAAYDRRVTLTAQPLNCRPK